MTVALVLLLTGSEPVRAGGVDSGARFPARGDLIEDQSLLDDAAGAWREVRHLPEAVYALWAGATPQGRVVLLQSGDAFQAVQFADDGGDPAVGDATVVGDSFLVSEAGVLVAGGLSERWRAMTRGDSDLAGVANLTSVDGLLPAGVGRAFLALVPTTVDERRSVPVLIGNRGRLAATRVDPRDWPRFRDAVTDGLFAAFVAAAFGVAAGESTQARQTRVLHIGEVPGDDIGAAVSTAVGERVLFGFASGSESAPDADLLGVAELGRPALTARTLERDDAGPWLVAAGSPEVDSISVRGSGVTRGNFALVERSRRDAADVSGRLESGRVIRVAP